MKLLALALCAAVAVAVGAAAKDVQQRARLGFLATDTDSDQNIEELFDIFTELQEEALGDNDSWCETNFVDDEPGRVQDSGSVRKSLCNSNVEWLTYEGAIDQADTDNLEFNVNSFETQFCGVGANMGALVRAPQDNNGDDPLFAIDEFGAYVIKLRSAVTHFLLELVDRPLDVHVTILLKGKPVAFVGSNPDNENCNTKWLGCGFDGRFIVSAPLPGGKFDELRINARTRSSWCIRALAAPCSQVSEDDDECARKGQGNQTLFKKRDVDAVESSNTPAKDVTIKNAVGASLDDAEFDDAAKCLTDFNKFDEGFADEQQPARLNVGKAAVAAIAFSGAVEVDGPGGLDTDEGVEYGQHVFCSLSDNVGGVIRVRNGPDEHYHNDLGSAFIINLTKAVDRVLIELVDDPEQFTINTWRDGKQGDSVSFDELNDNSDDETAGVFIIEAGRGKFDRIDIVQDSGTASHTDDGNSKEFCIARVGIADC